MEYTVTVNENLSLIDVDTNKIEAIAEGVGQITVTMANGYSKVFSTSVNKVVIDEPEPPIDEPEVDDPEEEPPIEDPVE